MSPLLLLNLFVTIHVLVYSLGPTTDEWSQLSSTLECSESAVVSSNYLNSTFLSENNRNYYAPFDDIIGIGVIYVGCEADVVRAFQFAKSYDNIPFSIRSGGHSAGSFSKCLGCIIIDLYPMNAVEIFEDESSNNEIILSVEPGATIGEFVDYLSNTSDISIPHGLCEGVGFGGLAQGGGIGFQMRKYGLTVDYIVGVDVIDCNGDIIRIIDDEYESHTLHNTETNDIITLESSEDSEDYKDVLWAIRGAGGGSFGIITKFYFKTYQIPSSILFFKIVFPILSPENITSFINTWKSFYGENGAGTENNGISMYMIFAPDFTSNTALFPNKYKININGLYYPDNLDGSDINIGFDLLQSFIDNTSMEYIPSYSTITDTMGYYDIYLNGMFPELPAQGTHSMSYQRARLIMDENDLSTDMVNTITNQYWDHMTDSSKSLEFLVLAWGSLRGNIQTFDVNFEKTSYESRDAWTYITLFDATPPTLGSDAIYDTASYWETNIFDELSHTQYINNVDDALYNITQLYPTPSNYQKLRNVKTFFDPDNCFKWKWSIQPNDIMVSSESPQTDQSNNIQIYISFIFLTMTLLILPL